MPDEDCWLTSGDPNDLIRFARPRESTRKLALLAAAITRRWEWLSADFERAIETLERFADGEATRADAKTAADAINGGSPLGLAPPVGHARQLLQNAAGPSLNTIVQDVYRVEISRNSPARGKRDAFRREFAAIAQLRRDVFGNPSRPVPFSPAWRTDTAVTLARQMYDARDFAAVPILADALQDAGCDSDEVLDHCRGPGPHVRGCWVVDLVLGKE
jgi:hypothetical protein